MNWTAFSMALLGHLLFQTHALAQESTTLGIHTFSYHNNGNYNDTTPGLYLERNQFVIGAYHNSIRKTSVYAGYTWDWALPSNPVFQVSWPAMILPMIEQGPNFTRYNFNLPWYAPVNDVVTTTQIPIMICP